MFRKRSIRMSFALAGIGCLTAIALPGATIQAATADTLASSSYVDEIGIAHYPVDSAEFPGSIEVRQQGIHDGDACSFSITKSGVVGEEPAGIEIWIEKSFDPAECTRTLLYVEYPSDSIPESVTQHFDRVREGLSYTEAAEESTTNEIRAANWVGETSALVVDPINIAVSETGSRHVWNSGGFVSRINAWAHYTPTGWSMLTSSTNNASNRTDTIGTFRNYAFCNPALATNTNHSVTRFTGYSGGTWSHSANATKSGDCSALLHVEYVFVHP